MKRDHKFFDLKNCTVCDSSSLDEIVSLPKFPFTGIYCKKNSDCPDPIYEGVDQGLMFCKKCGHAQLKRVIDPHFVYDQSYTHRGSTSAIAKQGNEFFAKFLDRLFPGKVFERIVDVGCNDGYLLQQLEKKGKRLLGIDPIWVGKDRPLSEKISLKGGFIEEVDLEKALGGAPDLVVSAHTFEHLENPRRVLENILSKTKEGAIFLIEVPSFDTLVRNHRFDQVFHQHIQYFSLASFTHLIQDLGGRYLDHAINHSMWGGTLLIAFEKKPPATPRVTFPTHQKAKILESYRIFLDALKRLSDSLAASPSSKVYGFGAAQMLPTLAYHVPSHLKEIESILDDNPERQGMMYPHLHFKIGTPSAINFADSDIVITAIDSARPILEKLVKLGAKRILVPLPVI